jgi:hypothetical protein
MKRVTKLLCNHNKIFERVTYGYFIPLPHTITIAQYDLTERIRTKQCVCDRMSDLH